MKTKSFLLVLILTLTISSYGQSGQDGNIFWSITDSVLTISGTGAMTNYNFNNPKNYSPFTSSYSNIIKEVVINEGITRIGNSTFFNCSTIISIELPNSITSIGESAFFQCISLANIELPNNITSIGEQAFRDCISLTSIEIPNGITSIVNSTFYGCNFLTYIEIPNSVTSIGVNAFARCKSLTNIEIPNSVTSIGANAFSECINLTSIVIPDGVTSIEAGTFSGCSSLTNIEIPDGVISIGNKAFWCSGITIIVIPSGVTIIEDYAFSNCIFLEHIELPNSITSIGIDAFDNCSSLLSIEIPDGITSIEKNTFRGCSSLISIEIPISVTNIGNSAFWDCINLKNIKISNSITSIGNYAFYNCNSLTSIKIPNSVTSIGSSAFSNMYSLTTVEVFWEEPLSCNLIVGYTTNSTLIVPAGTKALYEASPGWNIFKTIIERVYISVSSVSIAPKSATLVVGNSLQLVATVSPFDATDKRLTWASSNETVATVDSLGKLTAISSGSATISVTTNDGNKTSTFNLTVFEVEAVSISLDNKKSVLVNSSVQLTATINPLYVSNKNVTWSSSNTSVASVNASGMVTGMSEGRAMITVTTNNGKTATCMVAVTTSKLLNFATIEIPIGETSDFIIFDIERYEGDRTTNTFVLGLPEGLIIDPGEIIFTESLSEGIDFSVTPLGNNIWLFEIIAPVAPLTYSLLSIANSKQFTNITFKLTGDLSDKYEIILRNDLELNDIAIPKYELTLKSGETANSKIKKNHVNVLLINEMLTVDSPDNEFIKIYTSTGNLIFVGRKDAGISNFNISNLSSGIYIVIGDKGWSEKILKRQ